MVSVWLYKTTTAIFIHLHNHPSYVNNYISSCVTFAGRSITRKLHNSTLHGSYLCAHKSKNLLVILHHKQLPWLEVHRTTTCFRRRQKTNFLWHQRHTDDSMHLLTHVLTNSWCLQLSLYNMWKGIVNFPWANYGTSQRKAAFHPKKGQYTTKLSLVHCVCVCVHIMHTCAQTCMCLHITCISACCWLLNDWIYFPCQFWSTCHVHPLFSFSNLAFRSLLSSCFCILIPFLVHVIKIYCNLYVIFIFASM